jgi:hypothetical protein
MFVDNICTIDPSRENDPLEECQDLLNNNILSSELDSGRQNEDYLPETSIIYDQNIDMSCTFDIETIETEIIEATETEVIEATETTETETTETETIEATETEIIEATETEIIEATETEVIEATETDNVDEQWFISATIEKSFSIYIAIMFTMIFLF